MAAVYAAAVLSLAALSSLSCPQPQVAFVDFVSKSAVSNWISHQNASLVQVLNFDTFVIPDIALISTDRTGPVILNSEWRQVIAAYATSTYDSGLLLKSQHVLISITFLPLIRVSILTCLDNLGTIDSSSPTNSNTTNGINESTPQANDASPSSSKLDSLLFFLGFSFLMFGLPR